MLLTASVLVPFSAMLPALLLAERFARRMLLAICCVGLLLSAALTAEVWQAGLPIGHTLVGAAPLRIALRADGLSCVLLLTTAIVMAATVVYAANWFAVGSHAGRSFSLLLPVLYSGLNAVWLAGDLATQLAALLLLTVAAARLVRVRGDRATRTAARNYLAFALLGFVLCVLGAALLYVQGGTLDWLLLASIPRGGDAGAVAVALITSGLAANSALWPLHFWLPPAHGAGSAPVSALLSALVIKAAFFVLLRLWFAACPELPGNAAGQLLAALGAAAIIMGGAQAVRQTRLKLLIAYSTVAQVGYLFIVFAFGQDDPLRVQGQAWLGCILQVASHASAKAAMYLAAGLMAEAQGDDSIDRLPGVGRAQPLSFAAFLLGGMSLMGLPPSGGFVAKWLLVYASIASGRWWWAAVIVAGGLFTGTYLFRVVRSAIAPGCTTPVVAVRRLRQMVPLALALLSLGIGFVPLAAFGLVRIGRFA